MSSKDTLKAIEKMVNTQLSYIEASPLLKKEWPTRKEQLAIREILGRQTGLEWVRSIIEGYKELQ